MKKLLFIIIPIFFIFGIFIFKISTASDNCKYRSEIQECFEARKNGTTRTINDYVCSQSISDEHAVYQIILDKKFKIIDKEIEDYLTKMEKNKDFCFGPNRKTDYISCISDIDGYLNKYGVVWKKYSKICTTTDEESAIGEYLACYSGSNTANVGSYFPESDCFRMIDYKLSAYKLTAYNLLKQNKIQILEDFRKKQFQQTRTKYDKVIDNLTQNLDFVSRINSMWNYKTKNIH